LSRKLKRSPDASNTLRDLLSEAFVAKVGSCTGMDYGPYADLITAVSLEYP
jgi:hypothetical protein